MKNLEKIDQLRSEIDRIVRPVITGDYVLVIGGYHSNIGDMLLWRGSEDFLATTGYARLGTHSRATFPYREYSNSVVIVCNGGGNFGDLYRSEMEFYMELAERYPDNRIVILPQSAWYTDQSLIEADAARLSRHRDFHIFARDQYTYDLLKGHFSANNIYLAPDMAFYISPDLLRPYREMTPTNGTLYLRRIDKEFNSATSAAIPDAIVSDWPTLSKPSFRDKYTLHIMWLINSKLSRENWLRKSLRSIFDKIARRMVLNRYPQIGAYFVGSFERIITTRLHVLILSTLLGRNVQYIDNTSGKLSAFVNTWLNDVPTVSPYEA